MRYRTELWIHCFAFICGVHAEILKKKKFFQSSHIYSDPPAIQTAFQIPRERGPFQYQSVAEVDSCGEPLALTELELA